MIRSEDVPLFCCEPDMDRTGWGRREDARWIGPVGWKWLGWSEVRQTEGTGLVCRSKAKSLGWGRSGREESLEVAWEGQGLDPVEGICPAEGRSQCMERMDVP